MSLRIVRPSNRRGPGGARCRRGRGGDGPASGACRDRGRVRRRTAVRGVLLPVSPEATAEEARLAPRLTGATALITSVWRAHLTYSVREVPSTQCRGCGCGCGSRCRAHRPRRRCRLTRWTGSTLLNPRPVEPASRTDQDQVCLLAWTEGVGGTPACVQHTHRSPLAGLTLSQPAQTARRDRVHLNTLRPGCAAGPAGLLQAMVRGRPTVFMERLQAGRAAPGAPPRGDVGGGDGLPPCRAAQRGRTHRLGHRPSHRLPRARRDPTARGRRAGRPGGGGRAAGTHPCLTRPGRARTRACRAPRRPGKTARPALVNCQSYV